MKWWNIKAAIPVVMLLVQCNALMAQDSLKIAVEDYRTGWSRLIPKYGKLQYAGSMGFLSVGAGYDYGVHRQWESEVFLGFIPKFSTRRNKVTMTAKQNYIPWKIDLNEKFMIEPLTTGMYLTIIFDEDFWISEPDKYPDSYYAFSTRIRANAFIGQRITYKLPPEKHNFCKSVSLYYEVSTNDVYVLSAFNNSYLTPRDYLVLSAGIRMQFL